ncbi:MAG: hypothetical protein AAF481_02685 [Acidobacteriota bacterium]
MGMIKEEVKQMVDKLPEDATWDDLMYEIYVKQKVASASMAADGGQVVSHEEARKRMGRA